MKFSRSQAACLAALVFAAAGAAATLEEIAAQPQQWPAEVTVTTATRGTVIKDGQAAGAILIGAGRILRVTAIAADGITGRVGGDLVRVPADKTDLQLRFSGGSAPAAPVSPAPAPAAPPPTARAGFTPDGRAIPPMMQRLLEDRLVRLQDGSLQPLAGGTVAGVKYFALYYSAGWCGPCRQFTPRLVQAYRELKSRHPEFEIVFISGDGSPREMAGYMRESGMPWPAVRFDRRDQKITSYSGPGIPCLVLVDAQGRVLADSYEGDNYVGPDSVLQKARRLLKDGRL